MFSPCSSANPSDPWPERNDVAGLEVAWGRLVAAVEEAAIALRRMALSQVIRESFDYTCVLLTTDGRVVAQSARYTLPGFVRAASSVVREFRDRWSEWRPHDVAITNDPWIAAGHLHDLAVAVPVFHRGAHVGFSLNIAHQADMGGRGYGADGASVYEEGLQLPPLKLVSGGRRVDEVLEILAANVRLPDTVLDDTRAQIAAAELGATRLADLMDDLGLDRLDGLTSTLLSRSEAAMRGAIRELPTGTYSNELAFEGFDAPLTLRVAVSVEGDELVVDYAGTSPQVPRGINSPYNYTYGYTAFALKAVLEASLPNNDGCFAPLRIVAPEGTIVSARRPAPVSARGLVGHAIVPLVLGALRQACPDRIMADAGAPAPRAIFFGAGDDGGEFQAMLLMSAGLGGSATRDGASCKAFPTNTSLSSIELLESTVPLRFLRRRLIPDSGGPGRRRGGLGQEIAVRYEGRSPGLLSLTVERTAKGPPGSFGGLAGTPNRVFADGVTDGKSRTPIAPGTEVVIHAAGGGGYGPPDERDPDDVRADLRNGYVTAEAAAEYRPTTGTGR